MSHFISIYLGMCDNVTLIIEMLLRFYAKSNNAQYTEIGQSRYKVHLMVN